MLLFIRCKSLCLKGESIADLSSKLYIPSTIITDYIPTLASIIDCRCLAYFELKKYTLNYRLTAFSLLINFLVRPLKCPETYIHTEV